MTESIRVFAGECTISYARNDANNASSIGDANDASDADSNDQHGRVLVVHKPDGTVLVHDAAGYQPVEWLTRADAVYREQNDERFALVAVKDDERLRVEASDPERAAFPGTSAGQLVGTCPACAGTLVRARGSVTCLDCETDHGLPRDATLLDSTCECGLPEMAVSRGARFELCVDRQCESLDALVRERFDREWSCPDCGGDLRILRERALFLGCENYPDCERTFALPDDSVVGECECGLPRVETERGARCLDRDCSADREVVPS